MKSLYLSFFLLGIVVASSVNNKYTVDSINKNIESSGAHITHATATYNGEESYYVKPISVMAQALNITVTQDSSSELTINITNGQTPRFELPHEYPFSYTKVTPTNNSFNYHVNIEQSPFSFSVVRTATGEKIFDTSAFDLVYSEYFLTIGTHLPSQYLYGLGERASSFLYQTGTYTIWNRDQGNEIDNGVGGAQQTYGTHPVYLMREASGKWHMVYLRTTNAMEFNFDSSAKTLEFILTGGVIEFKFFLGDENPETAIKMYHNYINGWMIQPFWSHGYHQCRWGYENLTALEDVVNNMTANNLPLDVMWSDIDYMSNFTDFTVDSNRYNLTEFRALAERIHFVPIVDAGVAINKSAVSYNRGEELNVWMRSALDNGHPLTGVVWPGLVHYPDWYNANASTYWEEMVALLYDMVPVSGIWLDMNENSNFCVGEYNIDCDFLTNYLPDAGSNTSTASYSNGDESDNPYPWGPIDPAVVAFNSSALPYLPGGADLELHAISINGLHAGNLIEFDVHSLNGFWESMATNTGMQKVSGKRPFLLSRSTHVGSGQFTAHWTGDNNSTWIFLRVSIPTIFNFQIYGIPMTGADICGFNGDTTVELCARWMQLGAFYPFMRNHNTLGALAQEPYALGPVVLEASKQSLQLRYSIIKFYYSIFIKNNGLGSVFRPLFFEFHNDTTLLSLESQFLIGSELMVASVGYEGLTQVGVYFPTGAAWYDFFTGELIQSENATTAANITVDAPLTSTLPVFIKGGSIVHTQNVDGILNTTQLDSVFNFVVALTEGLNATGHILGISNYQDDATVDECLGQNDCLVKLAAAGQSNGDGSFTVEVTVSANAGNTKLEQIYLANTTIYGLSQVVQCTVSSPSPIAYGVVKYEIDSQFNCQLASNIEQIEN